jgi:hypothetical protein
MVVGGPLQGICLPYPLYPKGITAGTAGKVYAVPIIFTGSTCCPIIFRQYGMRLKKSRLVFFLCQRQMLEAVNVNYFFIVHDIMYGMGMK